jgi:hypothetical protein
VDCTAVSTGQSGSLEGMQNLPAQSELFAILQANTNPQALSNNEACTAKEIK